MFIQDHLTQLKLTYESVSHNARIISHKHKTNETLIDQEKEGMESIRQFKNEIDLKIENLKRELKSKQQEIDGLRQVKEKEIKNSKLSGDKALKEKDSEIKLLEVQKSRYEAQQQSSFNKVQDLETEKKKEVSAIQNEIKKLEEDVEALKNKMKNKENNQYYAQMNEFFGEVKEYIEVYQENFKEMENSRVQKNKLFELQRQTNEFDFKTSQNELTLKKLLDERLREKKLKIEQDLQRRLGENDGEKQKVQTLLEKKSLYESHLDQMINNISEGKERLMNLKESKEKQRKKVEMNQKKISKLQDELKGFQEYQDQIEQRIYKTSIEMKTKQDDKDTLFMLIPQILKALQGRSNNIRGFLNQLEDERLKAKMGKMLQNYKIQYK